MIFLVFVFIIQGRRKNKIKIIKEMSNV
jgi:hypothetical protein